MKKILFAADAISMGEMSMLEKILGKGTMCYHLDRDTELQQLKDARCCVVVKKTSLPLERLGLLEGINGDLIVLDEMVNRLKQVRLNPASNIITYGRCAKSAVITTSIEKKLEYLHLLYSLQRQIRSISGAEVESFEEPISVKGLEVDMLLYLVTCGLYFDKTIEEIKTNMQG